MLLQEPNGKIGNFAITICNMNSFRGGQDIWFQSWQNTAISQPFYSFGEGLKNNCDKRNNDKFQK